MEYVEGESLHGPVPLAQAPRALFDAAAFVETTPLVTPTANAYAAAVDGRRFLAAVRATDPAVPPIQLIVNWRTLLRDR